MMDWIKGAVQPVRTTPRKSRARTDHIIILDGTMSSLDFGHETNAGLTWKMLGETAAETNLSLYYSPGIQWQTWGQVRDVMEGRGINRIIRGAYGWLASKYRPGDRIFLMGYSRGAYAARSLAGIIDRVGLLRKDAATERNVNSAFRFYRHIPDSRAAREFASANCWDEVQIEMIGIWDTVKSLGVRAPIVWRWSDEQHSFHNHTLGRTTKAGYHALALHETRDAYTPVLWNTPRHWPNICEQVWFRGTHADVGGQVGAFNQARPLANLPLVWMLERLERHGIEMPPGWRGRFPCDPVAPSIGMNRGTGMLFMARTPRVVGRDSSESLHPLALRGPEPQNAVAAATSRPLSEPDSRVALPVGDMPPGFDRMPALAV